MLKKLLFSIFFFVLIVGAFKAYAFLGKVEKEYAQNVTYDNLLVVSDNDFNDTIFIKATSTPGNTLTFYADWKDDSQQTIQIDTRTVPANGIVELNVPHKWNSVVGFPQYWVDFTAKDQNNNPPLQATYKANVEYATITLTNNAAITQNANVTKGTNVTFTCTNSSEMYYGPSTNWPSGAQKVQSKYNGNSLADYTLNYNITLNTLGTYKVECDNVGGTNTRKDITFNVIDTSTLPSCPQGQVANAGETCHTPCSSGTTWDEGSKTCKSNNQSTFDITNINSSPNQSGAQNTFTWTSEADTCNVYTNDKATKLNPSASSKSGNNFSAIVPSQNMSNPPGSYLYYIKCYSATRIPSDNIEKDASDPTHTGWKSYTVSISCPAGQVANAGESCHAPCSTRNT